jgi:hypothetical protein
MGVSSPWHGASRRSPGRARRLLLRDGQVCQSGEAAAQVLADQGDRPRHSPHEGERRRRILCCSPGVQSHIVTTWMLTVRRACRCLTHSTAAYMLRSMEAPVQVRQAQPVVFLGSSLPHVASCLNATMQLHECNHADTCSGELQCFDKTGSSKCSCGSPTLLHGWCSA